MGAEVEHPPGGVQRVTVGREAAESGRGASAGRRGGVGETCSGRAAVRLTGEPRPAAGERCGLALGVFRPVAAPLTELLPQSEGREQQHWPSGAAVLPHSPGSAGGKGTEVWLSRAFGGGTGHHRPADNEE